MSEDDALTSVDVPEQPDTLDTVELATAVLVRNFELLRRRSDIYTTLDRSEYLLLRSLETTNSADIRSLAAALGLDPSTVGRQIAAMQHKGLVTRRSDPHDRRCSLISATAEGRSRMADTKGKRRQSLSETLDDWTDDELRAFAEHLQRYNRAIARQFLESPAQPRPTLEPLAHRR
ncbi:MarR family winged helix-turn-helix transcriptional regulator [Sciscionella marina]|uniref:MarR family winged helix-turn-helix transcriptional regulator n=1 Tax=Sciscionella marina TaxID=508770 RepID=UPI00037B8513|nr:MarR family transcriptional regulator [Sciscionella marina]